ncbi:MAG: hypothetical protein PHV74_04745 [Dehalococcoidia bacterium]|nr:hypothetical protein [Dehalococcoidia bacterium]
MLKSGKSISLIVAVLLSTLALAGMGACGGSDTNPTLASEKPAEQLTSAPSSAAVTQSEAEIDIVAGESPEVLAVSAPEPEPEIPELYLEVISPANESVLRTSEVQVTGSTIPTAIVSVNGILTSVNSDGKFIATTTLDAGANFIEIVASDLEGKEMGEVLTVVYLSS